MSIEFQVMCIAFFVCLFFGLGILYGWECKSDSPWDGRGRDEWMRGYNVGRRSGKKEAEDNILKTLRRLKGDE